MPARIAYIARGQLRLIDGEGTLPRDFDSPFIQQARSRASSSQRRSRWKQEGSSYAAMMARSGAGAQTDTIRYTGVARGQQPHTFVHAVDTGAVSGMFSVDAEGNERRLFHSERFDVRHVATHRSGDLLACCVLKDHVANVAVVRADGSTPQEVTEGDSLDLAPSWVPGTGRQVVFQSAGLPSPPRPGSPRAPFSIQLLDVDRGEMRALAEDSERDLLLPRMTTGGDLFYIRCPHRPPSRALAQGVTDVLRIPIRIGRGVMGFFDFFSRMQGGPGSVKPAFDGGRQHDDFRLKSVLLHGAAGEDPNADAHAERHPSHVSSAWELVKQRGTGPAEVVATGVFAYDVAENGALAWTDGQRIFHREPGGREVELAKDHLVHDVACLA
ncbi:MAG: hypothetical protein AB2A00_28255 [Myxococcota bacterium]